VEFGGSERLAYVLGRRKLRSDDPIAKRLKNILDAVRTEALFSPEQADLAQWMTRRYLCDLLSAVRCVAPPTMAARLRTLVELADPRVVGADIKGSMVQAHLVETLHALGGQAEIEALRAAANVSAFSGALAALQRRGVVRLTRELARPEAVDRTVRAFAPAAPSAEMPRMSPAGRRILETLRALAAEGRTPAPAAQILAAAQASEAALKTLERSGWIVRQDLVVRRSPLAARGAPTGPPPLTQGQQRATERLGNLISGGGHSRALLFGVTASGKTEVYLDAIARTLDGGRSALVLAPEIALTAQVVASFVGRFGEQVAVLHSRLSDGERHDEWRRIQQGQARIVVGARSGVFAPLQQIGLIVVDEEHEASYKQDKTPRYHARDVAARRAEAAGALLLLGSATPSVETFHAAQSGALHLVEMPNRIGGRELPTVSVVDMRQELKERKSALSRQLVEELGLRLSQRRQTILFLNRRGYAQFVLCRDCGHVPRCPNCAVTLTYHAARLILRCHHCDYIVQAPTVCPDCGGTHIRAFGLGTERIEEEVRKCYPSARVLRLDRDTTTRKGAHERIIGAFRRGEADVLIGTQMVAKGLDFPNVTLVGVVSADTGLNVPDFRAAERTFQLLTQVAGRAGRGEHPGTVVIQTFTPDHFSIRCATSQDYRGFYDNEIEDRAELRYPPFSRLANLVVSDPDEKAGHDRTEVLAAALKSAMPPEVEIIGPAPAPLARLRGQYRRHVVLRAPVDAPIDEYVAHALAKLTSAEKAGLAVDIDPMGMA
jgi:primosomal protein N' (replication factor Y)